jgi:transcriptional regulator with XRE-family HTH domain
MLNSSIKVMFSERLKANMKEKKISQKAMAKSIGVSDTTFWYYIKGERTPDLETLEKISLALDTPISVLLERNFLATPEDLDRALGDSAEVYVPNIAKIPYYEFLQVSDILSNEKPATYYYINTPKLKDTGKLIAFELRVDSMSPVLNMGDTIIINRAETKYQRQAST